jgi:hypothetical protein
MTNRITINASEKEEYCIRHALQYKLRIMRRAQLQEEEELRQGIQWKHATLPNSLLHALEFALIYPLGIFFVYAILPAGNYIEYLLHRRKILREHSNTPLVAIEKSLIGLWGAYGIHSGETKNDYDDIADCISAWISHLYGETIANKLNIRARLDQAKSDQLRKTRSRPEPDSATA